MAIHHDIKSGQPGEENEDQTALNLLALVLFPGLDEKEKGNAKFLGLHLLYPLFTQAWETRLIIYRHVYEEEV